MNEAESRPRPRLPSRERSRQPPRNATFLALGGLLAVAFGLTLLVTLVITGFAPAGVIVVLLIVSLFALVFGGHYLLWGIWLDRSLAARGDSRPVDFWKQSVPPPTGPPPVDLGETDDSR